MRWVASLSLTLALACGSEPPPSTPASNATEGSERGRDALADGRWHHFWMVRQARDAVVHGDLARARSLLDRIAGGELQGDMPMEWTVFVEEMEEEALRAARARSAHDVAQIVAAVASRCGDCHRSIKGRPRTIPLATLEQLAHGRTGQRPANADHGWAAEELWIGMTVPVHQAWVRGAEALTKSPLHAPRQDGDGSAEALAPVAEAGVRARGQTGYQEHDMLARATATDARPKRAPAVPQARSEAELQRGLEELADVGQELHQSGRPLIMARAYGNLIERCASCHEGGQPGGLAGGPAAIGPLRLAGTR